MVCFVFSCFLLNILIPGARQSTALFPDLKPGPGCPGGGDGGGDDDDDDGGDQIHCNAKQPALLPGHQV